MGQAETEKIVLKMKPYQNVNNIKRLLKGFVKILTMLYIEHEQMYLFTSF